LLRRDILDGYRFDDAWKVGTQIACRVPVGWALAHRPDIAMAPVGHA
jgi:hypothetical protein